MIWKSLKEEWPYNNDEVWLRWTEDGISWKEEIISQSKISSINALSVPEWREIEPPEWMSEVQKERFENLRKSGINWTNRVQEVQN